MLTEGSSPHIVAEEGGALINTCNRRTIILIEIGSPNKILAHNLDQALSAAIVGNGTVARLLV